MEHRRLSDESPVAHVRRTGTPDVAATVDWLLENGFNVIRTRGGTDAGFGDVELCFRGKQAMVVITRDRHQWHLGIAAAAGQAVQGLETHLDLSRPPRHDGPLPEQLPPGVVWRQAVPQVLGLD